MGRGEEPGRWVPPACLSSLHAAPLSVLIHAVPVAGGMDRTHAAQWQTAGAMIRVQRHTRNAATEKTIHSTAAAMWSIPMPLRKAESSSLTTSTTESIVKQAAVTDTSGPMKMPIMKGAGKFMIALKLGRAVGARHTRMQGASTAAESAIIVAETTGMAVGSGTTTAGMADTAAESGIMTAETADMAARNSIGTAGMADMAAGMADAAVQTGSAANAAGLAQQMTVTTAVTGRLLLHVHGITVHPGAPSDVLTAAEMTGMAEPPGTAAPAHSKGMQACMLHDRCQVGSERVLHCQ